MKKPLKKKWKPKKGELYYYIAYDGVIFKATLWYSRDPVINYGNCFETRKEATAARVRVRKALKTI